jgi:hypothetical protein
LIAARIVMLLPVQGLLPDLKTPPLPIQPTMKALGSSFGITALPRWLPTLLVAFALVLGIALHFAHPPIAPAGSPASIQTKTQPAATR